MTYQQSLKLCHELLNFVSPYKCEMIIFDFSSHTDFKLMYLDDVDYDLTRRLCIEKDRLNLPCATISFSPELGEATLGYADPKTQLEFCVSNRELIDFYCEEGQRSPNSVELRLEMARLKTVLQSGGSIDDLENGITN
jgi:hypothetical protein